MMLEDAMEAVDRPAGHASGLTKSLDAARCHAAWERALALDDVVAGLRAIAERGSADTEQDWQDRRIVEMRLWQAAALLRTGDPQGANGGLDALERGAGQSAQSRLLGARLAYFANDLQTCVDRCSEAIVLCKDDGPAEEIMRLWGDALCLMGESERAWTLLSQGGRDPATLTSGEIRALRHTVTNAVQLERFCALLAPSFRIEGGRGRMALYHYSMGCRDLRLYDRAIAAIRQRFVGTVAGETWGARRSPGKKASWVADAGVALSDLKSAMDRAGTPFFLISGTLLGCVREGGILGHDKDIDVGVMEGPGVDRGAVHGALSESGVFLLKPYQNQALLRLQHASGVMIDVFWHRLEDGLVIHEGMKSKWWNTAFDLVPTQFLGETYLIPDDYARYLGENYGDWEKPDAEFETFVDTPNMVITNEQEMVWYYYCKLMDYYALGKTAQFRKVFGRLTQVRPDDQEVKRIGYRTLELLGV
jgi:hypothetical protein